MKSSARGPVVTSPDDPLYAEAFAATMAFLRDRTGCLGDQDANGVDLDLLRSSLEALRAVLREEESN